MWQYNPFLGFDVQVCIRQAQRRSLSQQLIARLYVGASELLSGAEERLSALVNDKGDLYPHMLSYTAGGPKHLMAVGLFHAGRAAWDDGRRGEGLGALRAAKATVDAALAAGLMRAPWPSLQAQVAADMAQGQRALEECERDNRTVYFDSVPAWAGPPDAAFAASAAEPFVPPPPPSPLAP